MKKTKKKRTVAERAAGHVDFIDKVFGGRLYPFRSYPPYRAKSETPGKMSAPAPESTEEPPASSNPAVSPPVAPRD